MYKKQQQQALTLLKVCVCEKFHSISYVNQLSFNLPVVENLLVTLSSTTAYI